MPIYEFLCPTCTTLFRFFSRRVDGESTPECPRCGGRRLRRQASIFALSGDARGMDESDAAAHQVESREIAERLACLDDDDIRGAGKLALGLLPDRAEPNTAATREALSQLASGRDPRRVEAELDAAMTAQALAQAEGERTGAMARASLPDAHNAKVVVDPTLYDFEPAE